ncbi:MAG TPA: hypothetical protein VFV50_19825, partial [Bdellovibrionales bacterium]|nr:hypothetical protein [Bdellovibrionales bacterium]
NVLMLALAGATAFPMIAPSKVFAQSRPAPAASVVSQAELAALSESERMALQMLVVATILQSQSGELAKADPAVVAKYERYKSRFMNSVPTSILGVAAVGTGIWSSKKVDFSVDAFTAVYRASYKGVEFSSNQAEKLAKLIRLDLLTEWSSRRVEWTWKHLLEPAFRSLITKNVRISSVAGGTAAVAGTSSFFFMNDANSALTWDFVRGLLGQEREMVKNVGAMVESIAPVLNLNADAQNILKDKIFDTILAQALEHGFSADPKLYKIDLVEIMSKNNLINGDVTTALKKIQSIASTITPEAGGSASAAQSTLENVDVALGLAAILETQLTSGRITNPSTRAEIQRMLGAVDANLRLIGFSLKQGR